MSLHSNIGSSRRKKRRTKKKGKGQTGWGIVGRNLGADRRRSMQMFGWYPFGRPIALPESSEDEGPSNQRQRRPRTLSASADSDADAAPLEPSAIPHLAALSKEEQQRIFSQNFEPERTSEDLAREERELADEEESRALAGFAFPPAPPPAEATPETTPDVDAEPNTTLSPTSTPAPATPTTPALPSPAMPPSPSKSHASDRIRKAAKEQRRRLREEAERRVKEEMERRAEAAAGGFDLGEEVQEFGEFVRPERAWTETVSDGTSSHPSQPLDHPGMVLKRRESDEESMADYGAEYASRPKFPKGATSASGSDRAKWQEGLERSSNGSFSAGRPAAVPLPPSSIGSGDHYQTSTPIRSKPKSKRSKPKPPRTLSSHSGSQVVSPTYQNFDGVPGGLDEEEASYFTQDTTVGEEFDGTPGGGLSSATILQENALDLGSPVSKFPSMGFRRPGQVVGGAALARRGDDS